MHKRFFKILLIFFSVLPLKAASDSTGAVSDTLKVSIGNFRFEYMISPELETFGTVGFQIFDDSFGMSACRIQESHILAIYKEKTYGLKTAKRTGFFAVTRVGGGYIWDSERSGAGAIAGGQGGFFHKRFSLIVNYFTFTYTKNEVYRMKQQVYLGIGYDLWF